MSLKCSSILPGTYELAALEHLEKIPWTYNWRNVVTTPVPSLLIGSSSFLQATWTPINFLMGSKCGQIGPWTVESAALERLENLHRLITGERNVVTTLVISILNGSPSFGRQEGQLLKKLGEFEFRQDPITYYGVSSL